MYLGVDRLWPNRCGLPIHRFTLWEGEGIYFLEGDKVSVRRIWGWGDRRCSQNPRGVSVVGLAIALGTGTWVASVPWLAAAEPDSSGVAIADPSGLDLVGPAAADRSGLNIDVSYKGMDLFHMGDATAISGNDSLAIAIGDGSTADAGTYTADGV